MLKHRWLLPLLVIAGVFFAFARSETKPVQYKQTEFKPTAIQRAKARNQVRPGAVWPQLQWNLKALGETAGREQVTVSGTVLQAGDTQSSTFVLAMEASHRLTFTKSGLQPRITNFDSTDNSRAQLDDTDKRLVETILFDSAEGFFFAQANGAPIRSLGP